MRLSAEQSLAVDKIHLWLKQRSTEKWFFVLGGYAGTGKTFLLSHLVRTLEIPVYCCAPTGKAASVLSEKLQGRKVTTIHKLLYIPYQKDLEEILELQEKLKKDKNDRASRKSLAKLMKGSVGFYGKDKKDLPKDGLIIVDEASMVNIQMAEDLKKTQCRVLFVGDPGQLPPVNKKSLFSGSGFDYVLKVVHRQSLDSPIIRLSMDIRNGTFSPDQYQYADCKVLKLEKNKGKNVLDSDAFTQADQVITGMNVTRHKLNRWIRHHLKFKNDFPVQGDKVICLKNVSVKDSAGFGSFINGVQATVSSNVTEEKDSYCFYLDMLYEDRELFTVPVYNFHCLSHYRHNLEEILRSDRYGLMEFDYGYAITAHKAQGSEWDSVIVADDKMRVGDTLNRKRWLYTAVTRAKNKLLIVDM